MRAGGAGTGAEPDGKEGAAGAEGVCAVSGLRLSCGIGGCGWGAMGGGALAGAAGLALRRGLRFSFSLRAGLGVGIGCAEGKVKEGGAGAVGSACGSFNATTKTFSGGEGGAWDCASHCVAATISSACASRERHSAAIEEREDMTMCDERISPSAG